MTYFLWTYNPLDCLPYIVSPQDILCAQPNGGKNVLRADGCVPFNGQRLSVEFPWCCIVSLRPEMSPIYVLHRCCLTH